MKQEKFGRKIFNKIDDLPQSDAPRVNLTTKPDTVELPKKPNEKKSISCNSHQSL